MFQSYIRHDELVYRSMSVKMSSSIGLLSQLKQASSGKRNAHAVDGEDETTCRTGGERPKASMVEDGKRHSAKGNGKRANSSACRMRRSPSWDKVVSLDTNLRESLFESTIAHSANHGSKENKRNGKMENGRHR